MTRMQAIKHVSGLRVDGVDERVCTTAIGLYCGNAQHLTHADVRESALPPSRRRADRAPAQSSLAAANATGRGESVLGIHVAVPAPIRRDRYSEIGMVFALGLGVILSTRISPSAVAPTIPAIQTTRPLVRIRWIERVPGGTYPAK